MFEPFCFKMQNNCIQIRINDNCTILKVLVKTTLQLNFINIIFSNFISWDILNVQIRERVMRDSILNSTGS